FNDRRRVHRAELRPRRFSISRAAHLLILIALRERFGIAGSQPNAARTAAFHSASGNNCDWRMHASQIECFTTGPKYEHVTISSDICCNFRADDAVAGIAVIGAAKCGSASAI